MIIDIGYGSNTIRKVDYENLIQSLNNNIINENEDIIGKKVYVQDKSILQSKLREVFKIKRKIEDADLIIIDDFLTKTGNTSEMINSRSTWGTRPLRYPVFNEGEKLVSIRFKNGGYRRQDFITPILKSIPSLKSHQKFIYTKNIYKYLYKYNVDLNFFNQCNNLLKSGNSNNCKLAMELMTNANWEDDLVYLAELYRRYRHSNMRINYEYSTSFKGFEKAYESHGLKNFCHTRKPKDYVKYCSKNEHFEFVNSLYEEEFNNNLSWLINEYNVKINNIDYTINYNVKNELNESK